MRFLLVLCLVATSHAWALSDGELDRIGRRVWQNECGGTRDGLTSWNTGEDFASLGIGHFIWYPRGKDGPFEESFPRLIKYLKEGGAKVPAWLENDLDCPWQTRAEFQAEFRGERMSALREMLAGTVRLQSRFLAERMQAALPTMLRSAPGGDRDLVEKNFNRLAASGHGTFALIDYVNFKGEGTRAGERYSGQGWGLLQVLAAMPAEGPAARQFGSAAAEVLARRVRNAPPERGEQRWLPGWRSRVGSYGE